MDRFAKFASTPSIACGVSRCFDTSTCVISDLAGTTGLAIADVIVAGDRDPGKLGQLRDWRIKASEETMLKSLVGDYREENVFTLGQSLKFYRHYQDVIEKVDRSRVAEEEKPPKERNPRNRCS